MKETQDFPTISETYHEFKTISELVRKEREAEGRGESQGKKGEMSGGKLRGTCEFRFLRFVTVHSKMSSL